MNGKKAILFYCEWIENFESLSDSEAGVLIKHLLRYVNDLNPESPDRITELSFLPIKQCLKRDLHKWQSIKEIRSENGKLGGRPKKQIEAKKANGYLEKQTKAKKAVKVNVNVKDKVNVKDNNNINSDELIFDEKFESDFEVINNPEEVLDVVKKIQKNKSQNAGNKKAEVSPNYSAFIGAYFEFYQKQVGVEYKMSVMDGKAMKSIVSYMEKISTNGNPVEAWKFILDHNSRWGKYYQDQLKINQVDSNLPNIINQIKNGKGDRNNEIGDRNRTNANSADEAARIIDQRRANTIKQ